MHIGFLEFLGYGFIQRALIAGSFIGLICSILGVVLVLRRLSLIGDGLSHVTFGGVALGLFLNVYPLYVSLPVVVCSSLGILRLADRARMYGDAAIGIVSSVGIAVGVMLASIGGGFNIDLFSYLFGNILSISGTEVAASIVLSVLVLATVAFYFNEILSITFDEEFARASGIDADRINAILVILTGITVVLTMKVVGIMLTSALLILPAATAFQFARGFRNAMAISAVTSVISVLCGITASVVLNLPTGASIVLLNACFFLAAFLYKRFSGRRSLPAA
ncbi:MAG: metal ABC transporter permease [Nitrospiraceae bacterium]|nr:metal ABC transporter permease [Nitrospiraceae bacterium]